MKALLIAEKPSLMNDIRSAYNRHKREIPIDIDFVALHGHILALKEPRELDKKYEKWNLDNFPVTFPYEYKYSRTDAGLITQIKNATKGSDYDVIIHAGDPDQEGQLLVDELLILLGNKKPVLRFWTTSTTEPSIVAALKNLKPNEEYKGFYEAALLRQHSDFQIGMNITVAATVKYAPFKTVYRVGRVKAALLSLITELEKKIQDFVPNTSYKKAFLYPTNAIDKPDEFVNKTEYETKPSDLPTSAIVSSVKYSNKTVKAPKLFKLSSLQSECYKQFGWDSNKTLNLLCGLYEAHLVSYPRTDCEYLPTNIDLVPILGKDYPKTDRDYFNDNAIASEGHTAIIPTGERASLSGDAKKLYDLIYRRFCAIFAPQKKTTTVKVIAVANKEEYVWSYTWNTEDGFETVLNPQYKAPEVYNDRYKETMVLSPVKGIVKECVTKPPARYNMGSIIERLDMKTEIDGKTIEFSLGTPATRAKIVSECVDNGYFEIKKGVYYPTELAFAIMDAIGNLPIFDYTLSAQWEKNFKAIQRGEKGITEDYYIKLTHDMVNTIKADPRSRQSFAKSATATSLLCPHCNQPLVAKKTKTKKNIFTHEVYPNDCDFAFWRDFCGATFTEKDVQKFFNGEVVEKRLISNNKKPWKQKLLWNGKGFDFVK